MRFRNKTGVGVCVLIMILAGAPGDARADAQASTGLTLGFAETGLRTDAAAAFHLGARADVLYLRHRESDFALGPYADVATASFHTLQAGGGLEWLLPVTSDFPLVLSAGGFAGKVRDYAWEPGVVGGVFFGSRSYNFHSWYGIAAGLFVQGRYGLGDAREGDLVIGAQLDFELLALPFLFAYEAIAH